MVNMKQVKEFSSFEIRFDKTVLFLLAGAGTSKLQSYLTTAVTLLTKFIRDK
jgi:hypothetical protein